MKRIIVTLVLAILLAGLASPALAQAQQTQKNIVQTATDAGQFNTLVTAVKAAGLSDTLSTGGPYTVFAPNDAAFDKLPAGTVQSLVKDKPKLTGILKYHVVQGKYTAADLAKMKDIKTLDGKTLTIKKQPDGSLMINGAKVVKPDIQTKNGVIHAIDTVMMPK
ncbi:MAG: Fasciclin domain protein [Methanocella sp. PtaU1.Bin125]|nr:MAG: Fasciclin domain protein [Methanocella sp. PtaU1.Bin125]